MPFDPPVIPPERRDELAEEAYLLHAAECRSYRYIAEHMLTKHKLRMSHVTAGELVKEGRELARQEWPTRADVALQVHVTARHVIEKAWEEYRAADLSALDVAPTVLRALERLARLHGVDAPARISLSDQRDPVTVDPATAAAVRAVTEASAREVRELAAGPPTGGEDPTP